MLKRDPKPTKMPAKNSGIFSKSGAGQKMDPVTRPSIVSKTVTEAMRCTKTTGK